jgi:hypothetical protein
VKTPVLRSQKSKYENLRKYLGASSLLKTRNDKRIMPTEPRDFKSVMFLLSLDKNSPVRRDMHGNLIIKGVKRHKVTFRDDIESETNSLPHFHLIQSPPLPTCKS